MRNIKTDVVHDAFFQYVSLFGAYYEFDSWLSSIANQNNGIYRRYSDDFIVVIPASKDKVKLITSLKDKIIKYSKDKIHLKIEPHKTQLLFQSAENKNFLNL
ncbi:hypothetical protein [Limosilactobacillus pontis]|uniref:hypothetical protein n=1 Tax=Limosilactobacillus pontis TaxID=35787 RepID=UPI000708E1A7|nr:hypothetical protein [Limosilactobacillus pontis]QFV01124.1 hypothetical protein LP475_05095 [Limosilactobacillus pontis]